jgi:hypothetical protein
MKLGADRKRIYFLGALVLLGGYLFYDNVLSGPSTPEPTRAAPSARNTAAPVIPAYEPPAASVRRAPQSLRNSEEFRPSLRPKRPEDRVDPTTIDPTLRLDLLAKVQAVGREGGSRNLFAAGAPPLPPEPKVTVAAARPGAMGPEPPPPPPQAPLPPQAPPITLKYYGYSSARGENLKRAFFLDGDDILVASEGETVKNKRYRVVRIGVNSVVMEDTQFKHEQTLPLQAEAAG